MIPSIHQRILVATAATLGGLALLAPRYVLLPGDGASGLSLLRAHTPTGLALAAVILAGIPALAMGLFVAATGAPASGMFVWGAALMVLSCWGGPIDGWLDHMTLPRSYYGLALETMLWMVLALGALYLFEVTRPMLRRRQPWMTTITPEPARPQKPPTWTSAAMDLLGAAAAVLTAGVLVGVVVATGAGPRVVFVLAVVLAAIIQPLSAGHNRVLAAVGAALAVAALAAFLATFLLRNSDSGQVVGGLIVAFTLAAMGGRLLFPQAPLTGVFVAPFLLAAVSYVFTPLAYADADALLAAWYTGRLSGLTLALPIFYASAGTMGCALGVGLATGMARPVEAPSVSAVT